MLRDRHLTSQQRKQKMRWLSPVTCQQVLESTLLTHACSRARSERCIRMLMECSLHSPTLVRSACSTRAQGMQLSSVAIEIRSQRRFALSCHWPSIDAHCSLQCHHAAARSHSSASMLRGKLLCSPVSLSSAALMQRYRARQLLQPSSPQIHLQYDVPKKHRHFACNTAGISLRGATLGQTASAHGAPCHCWEGAHWHWFQPRIDPDSNARSERR